MRIVLSGLYAGLFILAVIVSSAGAQAPDLIITDLWAEGNIIHYQIQNIGDAVCTPPHATILYIDGQYRTKDVVVDSLKPGHRLNLAFLKENWTCTGLKQVIIAMADGDQEITEVKETNNTCKESWYCDRQSPQITEGPTVSGPQQGNYVINWKTNENADSKAYFGLTSGPFTIVSDTLMSQDHNITLTGLVAGAVYRFKVRSADASGNLVESALLYFTTEPPSDAVAPKASTPQPMAKDQPLFPLRFDIEATDNTEVDRVKFSLDGIHFMTDYDPPFRGYLDPSLLGLSADAYFGIAHTMQANAYDLSDNMVSSALAWEEITRCSEMELEIDLGTSTRIYTPEEGVSMYAGEIWIMAKKNAGMMIITPGTGPFPDVTGTNWDEVDLIRVYYDDDLYTTITPADEQTDITCPIAIAYLAAPSTHEIRVEIKSGNCVKTGRATMRVIRQITDLSAERVVHCNGTSFNVEITFTNNGTSTALLDTLAEEVEGFQITVPPSSLYDAVVTYDPQTRRSRIEYDFIASVSGGGGTYTARYTAIPILSEGVDEYQIGEDNAFAYHDNFGRDYTGPSIARTSRVDGQRFADAVDDACLESDYLIVTNPVILFGIHSSDSVNQLLGKMAELAKVRNGILAYYLGAGTMRTAYCTSDQIACGNVMGNWKDEVVLMDEGDDVIRIYYPNKQKHIEDILPISHPGLHSNDVLLVGNLLLDSDPSHPEDEIAVVDGHSSGSTRGNVKLYDYRPDHDDFTEDTNDTTYNPSEGDRIIAGDMIHHEANPDIDEIILFKGSTGKVQAYYGDGPIHLQWDSIYASGDLVAAGDLVTDVAGDEIIIGDISSQRIVVYSGQGDLLHQYDCTLESSDQLQVGADGLALADASADRVRIRGVEEGNDWSMGSFDTNVHSDDAFLCGRILDVDTQQYLLCRGHRDDHFSEGDIDIILYSNAGHAESPGDREHLEHLLNPDGQWAEKMGSNFTDGGYLLIVGETEIIPAFACSYYLAGYGREYIEFTDGYYGNSSGEMKKPEISVGRIIGNTIENMLAPIQTSLDVAAGDRELDFDEAYCFSGGDEEYFETARHEVVVALEDKGWHVSRHDEPSEDTFYANCSDRDAIYMAAHGNWEHCWEVSRWNVQSRFDPGTTAPIVYAASCLTGRYPNGVDSLGECFLLKGASAYIGATEVSYSPYNRHLSEGFFNRLNWGDPIGSALKGSKRNRMGNGEYGKYQSAIYHFFGDPKLQAVSAASASASQWPAAAASEDDIIQGPLSTLKVAIPDFGVRHTGDGDIASIPGGAVLSEPGHPEVPAWPVHILFPAGKIVQDVQLVQTTESVFGTGLSLIEVQPFSDSQIHPGPTLGDSQAWPDRQYDWTTEANPDGSTILTVHIYPLRSWPATTNYTFFNDCTLNIDYTSSTVTINRLWTDHKAYSIGDTAEIELFIRNTSLKVFDVIAEAELVRTGAEDQTIGLPLKYLRGIQRLVSCGWTVDTANLVPDTYDLTVRIKNTNGLLLAERSTPVQMGISDGLMHAVTTNPVCFGVGQDIKIHSGFSNTGQTYLNPVLIVEIQANDGTVLQRFEDSTTLLAPGSAYLTHWEWDPTCARGECRFKAYALYDGKTTPVKFYPELSVVSDGDFNEDGIVNLADFAEIAEVWLGYETLCDIAPDGGDCTVNMLDLNVVIDAWLQ
jgi:hypothetical protein